MTVLDLESEVLKLTPKDRARIAQKLLESLETLSKQEIESLWLDEAERRDQALDEDPSRAIPAAEVMREARARLSSRLA
jgi:putative addiction module component (TIGR02574 family)